MSKTIIAGCRNYQNYDHVREVLTRWILMDEITEIVSGGAHGVDYLGERFATEFSIPVKRFPADWNKHGKSAGPIRNREMAEYADQLIAFWDGKSRGTKNMIETMQKMNKPFTVYEI